MRICFSAFVAREKKLHPDPEVSTGRPRWSSRAHQLKESTTWSAVPFTRSVVVPQIDDLYYRGVK